MRGWLVRRDTRVRNWIGDVYDTHAAAVANCPSGCEIVEIELPDPRHEWKVGDWADYTLERLVRIVAIDDTSVAFVWWDGDGGLSPRSAWEWRRGWDEAATPCDPPAWFVQGGAS